MSIEIMTKSDLMDFKSDLFKELKAFLAPEKPTDKKWLRSSEVRKLLGISTGTLHSAKIVLNLTKSL
jgi:hypothetical protein